MGRISTVGGINLNSGNYTNAIPGDKPKDLEHGRGIKYNIDAASEIMGNPIVMFDLTYKMLAHSDNRTDDDPLWNELVTTGGFSHNTVNFFNEEHFIEAYAVSDIVALLKSDKLKYDRLNGKLFGKDDVQIGDIAVVACYKPFDQEDYNNLERICEFFSLELQNSHIYQQTDRITEETLIGGLINKAPFDKTYSETIMNELYEGMKQNLYIGVLDIIKYDHTLTHLAYFCNLLEKKYRDFKFYIYGNYIVFIASSDDTPPGIKTSLSVLDEFFTENNIYAGISESFCNLFDLHEHYKQAIAALIFGVNDETDRHIYYYDEFKLEHKLNSFKDMIDLRTLCNPAVFRMKEYDTVNGTDYFDSVRLFLQAGKDMAAAAKLAHMPEEVIRENVEEAGKLFGFDWTDGNILLNIFVSIKIARIVT